MFVFFQKIYGVWGLGGKAGAGQEGVGERVDSGRVARQLKRLGEAARKTGCRGKKCGATSRRRGEQGSEEGRRGK